MVEEILICNNEFAYEDFCGLPKGHNGPCGHPSNPGFHLTAAPVELGERST
jgi:hypothetical protein